MDKRYQVFISSTFDDLVEERQSVLKGILELDHMPAGMELFPATDDTAWRLICDVIDVSDYYVLVIGGRYGSLDSTGISFTEKEYGYAVVSSKPVIALLHAQPDNLPRDKTETDPDAWEKLGKFRAKVERSHTCVYWNNANELKSQLIIGLTAATKRHPAQGWVKSDFLASDEATRKILSLQEKIELLNEQLYLLASTSPEGADRLSQGDESIEVKFKATFGNSALGYHDPDKNYSMEYLASVTWNELLGAIGPSLMHPTRETKIKSDISRFLKRKVFIRVIARK